MKRVNCKTQAECDAALAAQDLPILLGDGWFKITGTQYVEARESSHVEARESSHVEARGSSHVEAWESSHVEARESSHVVARESSHVEARESSHVVARESSHVEARESSHVEARESSHVVAWGSSHVVAWGSSHVVAWGSSHVEARGSSHVVAWGSSHVEASAQVAVHKHSPTSQVSGGVIIVVKIPKTPVEWCEYYGAKIENDHAILFKGVDENYLSPRGGDYTPGTMPQAADWDGGKQECGYGFHFSPHPLMTLQFNAKAKKFVACPVKLEDIFIHPQPEYPNKVKAKGVSMPIWEVDRYGKKL